MNMASDKDEEHLKLLSIFHYVVAGIVTLFACFPIIHLGIGIALICAPKAMSGTSGTPPPPFVGWLFAIIGGSMVLFGWSFAVCVAIAGRFLARRRHYLYCLVTACISCLFVPFGTILGVFTITALSRSSAKNLFT